MRAPYLLCLSGVNLTKFLLTSFGFNVTAFVVTVLVTFAIQIQKWLDGETQRSILPDCYLSGT